MVHAGLRDYLRDLFVLKPATSHVEPSRMLRMRINVSSIRQILCQIKMAIVQAIFEEGVQSAASRVKEEFPGNQAADLTSKEFQKLAGSCLQRHLEVGLRKMRYELVQVWPMVERELANLRRLIMRRVKPTGNALH